ncbi:MAG TPA: SDR family NAD(P)-dependent oxidoreductase [bacterium]|nr:SDR family NAD(P)-dependent oxidoreductase [bacterium]
MGTKHKGKTALVTGAARGLGRLIALDLAREGADVAVADLREGDLQATAAEIGALGVRCFPLAVDLRTKDACNRMVAEAREKLGRIDVLVNNAGVVWNADVVDQSDEVIQATVDINFMAQVWATRAALPEMIAAKSGTIVSIASGAGKVGVPAMAIYCATKFALIGFFDSLRHELRKAGTGVRVIVVCPGFMATKMFVGAKVPRFTTLFDPQKTSTALMKAMDKGKEEVYVPWTIRGMAISRGLYSPRLMERMVEFTGMHESFYTSKTID